MMMKLKTSDIKITVSSTEARFLFLIIPLRRLEPMCITPENCIGFVVVERG
ncbi:MAG: hypothetical protein SFY68_04730 [Candidatus Sumerlaeia bacterium]|nr:hypothetical protein [Candidatus Sumerlaeia bacterium]